MATRFKDLPPAVQANIRQIDAAAGKAFKRRSKYRAVKTKVDGVTFASKREASWYEKFKAMKKKGEVLWFSIQPRFVLPGDIVYIADFIVVYPDRIDVVDVKGFKTPEYRLKKKLMASIGITIHEVT